ncbi:MAG: hypothetical protein AAFQ94_10395 [Bacteroidota bacterium]
MKTQKKSTISYFQKLNLNMFQLKQIRGGAEPKKPNLQKVVDVRGMGKK